MTAQMDESSSSNQDDLGRAEPQAQAPSFRQKNLKKVPVLFFEQHATLRAQGKITGDFSTFIVEAIREKLHRHQ
ncbi:hypothetical protein [Vibrio sp. WXL210]|uniref:hypothetical protein n=1 Tax=Vibrio sp. WXL210 TaxID=3450709 RepID=UPI003EC94C38